MPGMIRGETVGTSTMKSNTNTGSYAISDNNVAKLLDAIYAISDDSCSDLSRRWIAAGDKNNSKL